MTNNQMTETWSRAFRVTLGNLEAYKRRLKELTTWDKPQGSPSNDKAGKWREYECKKIALEELISDAQFEEDERMRNKYDCRFDLFD